MATVTKQFSFNTDLEGWTHTDTNATGSRDTTDDSPNDTNAGNGNLKSRTTGKKISGTVVWQRTGITYEDLGVPSGATVTGISVSQDWKCSEFTTGTAGASNSITVNRGAGDQNIHGGVAVGGTTAWASSSGGAGLTGLTDASNTALTFKLSVATTTGNSSSAAVTILTDWIQVTVTYTLPPAYDQDSYRFRNDDGSETTATWRQAVNTPDTIPLDTPFRLRIAFEETGGNNPPSTNYDLEYRRKPSGGSFGAWTTVPASNDFVTLSGSANIPLGGGATTRQIWASATNFAAGVLSDDTNPANADYAASVQTEWEMCLVLDSAAGAAAGDTYEFRIAASGTPFDTYTNTPSLTVPGADSNTRARMMKPVHSTAVQRAANW